MNPEKIKEKLFTFFLTGTLGIVEPKGDRANFDQYDPLDPSTETLSRFKTYLNQD